MTMFATITKILMGFFLYQLLCAFVIVIENPNRFSEFDPFSSSLFVGFYCYCCLVVHNLYDKLEKEGKFDTHTLSIVQVVNVPASAQASQPMQSSSGNVNVSVIQESAKHEQKIDQPPAYESLNKF